MIPVRRLADLPASRRRRLFERPAALSPAAVSAVRAILRDVRRNGDAALRRYTAKFDGATVDSLESRDAPRALPAGLAAALRAMKGRIERFHRRTLARPFRMSAGAGATVGMRVVPFARAGIYVPGGLAAYPSTVLMAAIPARLAGVREIVLCSPPGRDGRVADAVLAAARLAGVHRVFRVGGAQAVAAMACGTESVPRVDILVGPGNAYVSAAKHLVRDDVAIEFVAGPTEVMVLGDGSAPPEWIAAELAAQGEHGPSSAGVLLTTSEREAHAVAAEWARISRTAARAPIVAEAMRRGGSILLCRSIDEAVAFADEYAPEHLLVATRNPDAVARRVTCAGAVSIGAAASVALADYGTGPNHILPTNGSARRLPALTARTFQRLIPYQRVSLAGARRLARSAAAVADAEGLHAHAAAIRLRR